MTGLVLARPHDRVRVPGGLAPLLLLTLLTYPATVAQGQTEPYETRRAPAETIAATTRLPATSATADPEFGRSDDVHSPWTETAEVATDAADLSDVVQRLEAIEKQLSAAAAAKAAPSSAAKQADDEAGKSTSPKSTAQPADDAWVDVSDDKWTVKLGGHVQMDMIHWADAPANFTGAQDYFEFRRLRLVADGTGYGMFDFRLQMTLEPETVCESPAGTVTSPDVKDAYFSVNDLPLLGRWRIGNFFVPFSLEQVTNDTNNTFMERSIPSQGVFAADREVGMASYNVSDNKRFTWTYGVFLDSVSEALKERIDDNQGYRVSGRVTWLPYYDEPSNGRYLLHLGAGVLYTDDQDNRVRFRSRPQIHEGPRVIDTGVIDANQYTTGNLEAAVVWGRFAVQSEAFLSGVNRTNGDTETAAGSYVHGSYFLTGENRLYERFGQHGAQFARNVPNSNFFVIPGGFSPGAWEVKARWSYLDLAHFNAGIYNDLTAGFNWYWTDRTRIMFDWVHPFLDGRTTFGASEADVLAMRFDFNW